MKTLVELYDERAIENIIGPETFRPDRVVYLCPKEIVENKKLQRNLELFFIKRGLNIEVEFIESSLYKVEKIIDQLNYIHTKYPDIVLDITGGNDATLFAAGMFSKETGTPAFTYSRKSNKFYNINGAEFAHDMTCNLEYNVEDFFEMAGGRLRKGRVENSSLRNYIEYFDPFFSVFLKYRREWNDSITFFQRISQSGHDEEVKLEVMGKTEQKSDHGRRVNANHGLLHDLEKIGFLQDVRYPSEGYVSFTFKDEQIRAWLRDVGSVLELFMYKACIDADIFGDVISSAIVDWEGYVGRDSVSNEIDVVATRGIIPIFISCKACEVKTEALNELAILRDRFGGKGAKAAIATTEFVNAATRHRAAQLGIAVIDLEEMENGLSDERLQVIMKVRPEI